MKPRARDCDNIVKELYTYTLQTAAKMRENRNYEHSHFSNSLSSLSLEQKRF